MTSFLYSATAFLVAIGILVAVHEFGHFIMARALGVKVLRFSIGFGKPLWIYRGRADGTEYCLSAIPFGGYVKLLDERDCQVTFAEQPRAFNRQGIPARIAILAAGPLLNFVFAVAAYWLMFVVGVPGTRPVVGEVAPNAIAARAGLIRGDEIVRVGDRETATWEAAIVAMLDELLSGGQITLEVARPGRGKHTVSMQTKGLEAELTEPGQLFTGLGFRPWAPKLAAVVGELTPGGPAARAGLKKGDLVIRAGGETIDSWPEWVEFVRARPGQRIDVTIQRAGAVLTLPLEIEAAESEGKEIGRIGAAASVPEGLFDHWQATERYGVAEAFRRALLRTWDMATLTVRLVARMATGDVSVKNISGPINIAQYAGYSASIGVAAFLSFLAVVSISLGILNLLPIPMLDGGQIAYQLAEAATGAPLSERAQLIGQQVGIFFLLLLMSFAVYNDLSRLLG